MKVQILKSGSTGVAIYANAAINSKTGIVDVPKSRKAFDKFLGDNYGVPGKLVFVPDRKKR